MGVGFSRRRRPGRQGAPVAGRDQSGRPGTWQGWEVRVAFLPLAQATFENQRWSVALVPSCLCWRRSSVSRGPGRPTAQPAEELEGCSGTARRRRVPEPSMIQGRGQGWGWGECQTREERHGAAHPHHPHHTTHLVHGQSATPPVHLINGRLPPFRVLILLLFNPLFFGSRPPLPSSHSLHSAHSR